MNILLICSNDIVVHIFSLICKRLKVDLTVQNTTNVETQYDLIIIDQPFIDESFAKIKRQSLKIGAISAEELPFDKPRDFLIPRPFLPTKLEAILKEQIEILAEEKKDSRNFRRYDKAPSKVDEKEIINEVVGFVSKNLDDDFDDLADFYDDEDDLSIPFIDENSYEEDESIVSLSSIQTGGVLDDKELDKINTILKESDTNSTFNSDWKDISEIIDEALDEVKEYEFEIEEKYHLVLSKFKIDELKPLLTKLNQQLVDKIAKGETVEIQISLKD